MKSPFNKLDEFFTWIISFLAGEDFTRMDRKLRMIGFSLTFAVVVCLTLWERFEN